MSLSVLFSAQTFYTKALIVFVQRYDVDGDVDIGLFELVYIGLSLEIRCRQSSTYQGASYNCKRWSDDFSGDTVPKGERIQNISDRRYGR